MYTTLICTCTSAPARTYTLEIKKKQRGRCYRCSCLTCPGPKYTQLVESTGHPPASVWHGSVGIQTNPSPLCPGWQMHSNWAGPVTRQRAFSSHGGSADAQRSITAYTASPPYLTTILTSYPHPPSDPTKQSVASGRAVRIWHNSTTVTGEHDADHMDLVGYNMMLIATNLCY